MVAPTVTPNAPASGLQDLDTVFKGFAHPIRIRILNLLAAGELGVRDLAGVLALPPQAVSRHLAHLTAVSLVTIRRDSNFAHYRLGDPTGDVHRNIIACVRCCFRGIKSLDAERQLAIASIKDRQGQPIQE
jgi:ArsR family transcriptional regulator